MVRPTRSQGQASGDAPPASQSTAKSRRSRRLAQAPAGDNAPPASQSSQSTAQDSTIKVTLLNWTLFDKSDRIPRVIGIERDLYDGPSSQCRQLFAKRLSKEYKVSADAEDIVFWTVGGTSFSWRVTSEPL
jgi:hypothetical protein